jgi:hypothetical protein
MDPSLRFQLLHAILLFYEDSFPQTMKMYYEDSPLPDSLYLYFEALCIDQSTGYPVFEPEEFYVPFSSDIPVDLAIALSLQPPIQIYVSNFLIDIRARVWIKKNAAVPPLDALRAPVSVPA